MTTWTDTTGVEQPPAYNVWQQARWLVGRHRRMQILVERVGAIDDVPDGDDEGRWPHVEMLADIIRASDAYGRAWDRYRHSNYEPSQREGESEEAYNARWDAYEARAPKPEDSAAEFNLATAHGIRAYRPMSSGEKKLLRILATFGVHRVEFSSADLDGLDDEGWDFVRDWVKVILRSMR